MPDESSRAAEAAPPPTDLLVIARIVAPQGVRGEVRAEIVTDFPERFRRTRTVYVGEPPRRYELTRSRLQRGQVVLKLAGVESRDEAEKLRGQVVSVPVQEAVPLPPGEFFWHQVVGLRVEDVGGRDLGRVGDILRTGSHDVYVVETPEGELLLPAIKQVIKAIEPERGRMVVELLPGLEPAPRRARGRPRLQRERGPRRPGGGVASAASPEAPPSD